MMHIEIMMYEWNPEKNEWLKKHRNISFEQVIFHLSQGDVWKIAKHPNQKKYAGQKIYFVIIDEYAYLVPYIIETEYIFLKTIIPSRKVPRKWKNKQEM
jgi:hypothetical protein